MLSVCESGGGNRCVFRYGLQGVGHVDRKRPPVNIPFNDRRERGNDRLYAEAGQSAEGAERSVCSSRADDLKKARKSSS